MFRGPSTTDSCFQPMTVADMVRAVTVAPLPVRIRAFDGSVVGHGDVALELEITSVEGLAYIVTAPGDLGMARAYLTGGLVPHGVHEAHPYAMFDALKKLGFRRPSAREALRIAKSLKAMGAVRLQPAPPQEVLPAWRRKLEGLQRHSRERDSKSVSHHYDTSNEFYSLFLGPSMTYTCGYFPSEDATLEEAQENKYRLVFDKLRLREGERLLDVGCGWGGMVRYAARRGVRVTGVTLSREQADWGNAAIAEEGLGDLAEIRLMDYRDVPEGDFDAVSAIGILEHVGASNYRDFFTFLYGKLRTGGRMLNHCITRPRNNVAIRAGQFMDRYIFPDGELDGPGTIRCHMENAGFDVLHQEDLRPHYARTLHHWCRNLEANWDEARALVGDGTAKLYGIYMAGSEWAFDNNDVQLHHFLGVKLHDDGSTGLPERQWWTP
ncbi:class I SAM-dependent methyltransferase [Corynebacterium sp. 335C]